MSRFVEIAASVIASGAGIGRLPAARGTAGSLAALLAAMLLASHYGWGQKQFALLAASAIAPAAWSAGVVARARAAKDPQSVVADEMAGQWIALAGVTSHNWKSWLAAFLLFRLFDIWKPWPVRRAESLPGGLGIVADDVAAGLYAAAVLFAAGCFSLY